MGGFWQNHHRLRPSELCSTICSNSLTTTSAPTIFRKLWVDSEPVIGSELCYRSPPSSTFVKQLSFPICNTALQYLETVSRGRHWNGSNIAEYHHPFSVRAQMVRSGVRGVLPRESPLVLNGRSMRDTNVLHSPKGPCNRKASIPSEEDSIPGRGRPCNTRFIYTWNRYRAVSLLL